MNDEEFLHLATFVDAVTLSWTVWREGPPLATDSCGNTAALHERWVEMTWHTESTAHSSHAIERTTPHPRHHAHSCIGKQFIRKHTHTI